MKWRWYFGGSVLGILFIGFFVWLFWFRWIAYTDDAYVQGNQIWITPLHDGIVTRIHTDDTFLVREGEIIAELDPTDALIAVRSAEDNLGKVIREVCQIFHRTFALQSEIEVRFADLILAKQDWDHRIDVIEEGGVSLENLQHAEAQLKSSFFSLKATESLFLRERALIEAASIRSNPLVQKAKDDLEDAVVRLYRCTVYAPNTGLIAQRRAQVGMYMKAGDPMMSVIPLDQIWVNANYKETQMKKMRIGQTVNLHADLYGLGITFHGTIVGLPGGAGNAFSILPPQNLSGNWIKIVQRLPVRVALIPEELEKHPLRIGLTMRATTHLRGGELTPSPDGPLYLTKILVPEESGVKERFETILKSNLDPLLQEFENEPVHIEYTPISQYLEDILQVTD